MDSDRLVDEREAAAWLGVRLDTLRTWRRHGRGPAHVRLGKCVRYRRVDVARFIRNNLHYSPQRSATP